MLVDESEYCQGCGLDRPGFGGLFSRTILVHRCKGCKTVEVWLGTLTGHPLSCILHGFLFVGGTGIYQ